ncbi:vacuolar import and degradation protein-domain-containing protein [Cercophora newfieldiana]|uniref:Vacuolar import and degradation protein-domain-containing protein n=1 Tax=Cercophora newfieldiana TaxID=92897 RepID=A0AA39YP13_9PEZI|nr:vacuolar import and degradation protein-domain-containing protein [Cercophora newfieldiana]
MSDTEPMQIDRERDTEPMQIDGEGDTEPMQIDGEGDTDGESSGARMAATTGSRKRKRSPDLGLAGGGDEYSRTRVVSTWSSSFLRPRSRFKGTQQYGQVRYDVQVEIKHADLRESVLCGFLTIQGLTEDYPTLTTYFESEIIGPKYGFITEHPEWDYPEDDMDITHWSMFPAFHAFKKLALKGEHAKIDFSQKDCLFMRWKEQFLVPDHRVREIDGASMAGFYYICFDQVHGDIIGMYVHSRSENFQWLELKHVKGGFAAMEFR